jgi:hypothetical protein
MPFPLSPPHQILERMKTIVEAADLHTAFGMAEPFKVRHTRNRVSMKTERPCIALRLASIELDPNNQQIHTQAEVCWAMTVDIVVDMELEPEKDGVSDDPTGWNQLSATANEVANLFLDPASDLLTLVDDTLPGDVDPDEDSTPDEGRLAQSIVVLYRTLRSDLNHLLNSEENAP